MTTITEFLVGFAEIEIKILITVRTRNRFPDLHSECTKAAFLHIIDVFMHFTFSFKIAIYSGFLSLLLIIQ